MLKKRVPPRSLLRVALKAKAGPLFGLKRFVENDQILALAEAYLAGRVTKAQLQVALRSVGYKTTSSSVYALMRQAVWRALREGSRKLVRCGS